MLGRWTALAVFLGSSSAAPAAADPGASCELARADRTRTPSSRCLACHDGSATHVLGSGHPVDVDYARASAMAPGLYESPLLLRRDDVTLVEGKVACVSCHSPSSPHRKHAVAPARLCSSCHRL